MNDVNHIKQLVAENRLEEAFSELETLNLDDHFQDMLILLRSRLNQIKRQQIRGTISSNEGELEVNRITSAFSSILEEIQHHYPQRIQSSILSNHNKTKAPTLSLLYSSEDKPQAERLIKLLHSLQRNKHLGEIRSTELASGELSRRIFQPDESSPPEVFMMMASTNSVDLLRQAMHQGTAEVNPFQGLLIVVLLDVNVNSLTLGPETAEIHTLPKNQKPIAQWKTADEAWLLVIKGLKDLVQERFKSKSMDVKP